MKRHKQKLTNNFKWTILSSGQIFEFGESPLNVVFGEKLRQKLQIFIIVFET